MSEVVSRYRNAVEVLAECQRLGVWIEWDTKGVLVMGDDIPPDSLVDGVSAHQGWIGWLLWLKEREGQKEEVIEVA